MGDDRSRERAREVGARHGEQWEVREPERMVDRGAVVVLVMQAELAAPPNVTAPLFAHPSAAYAVTLNSAQAQMQSTLAGIGAVQSGLLPVTPGMLQPYIARWGCVFVHSTIGGSLSGFVIAFSIAY